MPQINFSDVGGLNFPNVLKMDPLQMFSSSNCLGLTCGTI